MKVKKGWKEVSIADYKRIVKITESDMSEMDKQIAILSILSGEDEETLLNTNINEVQAAMRSIAWVYDNFKFNEDYKAKKIVIDGETYDVGVDINKFSVAQYMDFQNFWSKRDERMGNLLATFIVPKGHKYNEDYDAVELADKLEHTLSIVDYNNVCFFFLREWRISIKASTIYSVYLVKRMIRKTKDPEMKKKLQEKKEELEALISGYSL